MTSVITPLPRPFLGSHLYYNKNKRPPYIDPPKEYLVHTNCTYSAYMLYNGCIQGVYLWEQW